MPDATRRVPSSAELRHLGAVFVRAADACHPDSLRRTRYMEQAALARSLADGLDAITEDGLWALEQCVDLFSTQYGESVAAREALAAVRALLTQPESADAAGRVVGRIEAQITGTREV